MRQATLIAICIIALYSCKKDAPDAGNYIPDYNDLTGTWIMTSFKDNATGAISPRPANLPSYYNDPYITLVVKDSNHVDFPDGSSLWNWMGDGDLLIYHDKTLKFLKCAITMAGEPDWGLRFMAQLPRTNRYFFTDINHLCFVTSSDTTLNFKRK